MPTVLHSFLCEDLRLERSGQITAVGIWGSQMLVPRFPAVLRSLAYHAHVLNPEGGKYPFVISMEGPFDGAVLQHGGVLAGRPSQNLHLTLAPVMFLGPGLMRVTLQISAPTAVAAVLELRVALMVPPGVQAPGVQGPVG